MSADNYMFVRSSEGRFVVTMEFASDDTPGPIHRGSAHWFDCLDEAMEYASGEWTEYGVRLSQKVKKILRARQEHATKNEIQVERFRRDHPWHYRWASFVLSVECLIARLAFWRTDGAK